MNAKCRELFHWCHLHAKMNDTISKSAPLIIIMHSATRKMRTRDLPNTITCWCFISCLLVHYSYMPCSGYLSSCLVSLSSKTPQMLTMINYPKKLDKDLTASLWKTSQRENAVRNCHPIKCKTMILGMFLC